MSNPTHRGILAMILASLGFSIMGALVKAVSLKIPFSESVFFRAFISLVILVPWMAQQKIPFLGKNWKVLLVRSAAGFTALCLSFYTASEIKLADASILNHTSTLFVALLSPFFLNEKMNLKIFGLIVTGLLGASLIVKPSFNMINVPGLAGLASGFFAAIAYISIKKLHRSDSSFTIVFIFVLFSTIASLILFGRYFVMPSGWEWVVLMSIGAVGVLAQLMLTYAYKLADASTVSPYMFSTVIFSALWGALFWKELPDIWSWIGGMILVATGILILKNSTPQTSGPISNSSSMAPTNCSITSSKVKRPKT